MIKKSFVILPGVGEGTEKKLWNQGVHTWDHFLEKKEIKGISAQQKMSFDEILQKAKRNLDVKNHEFFSHRLPTNQHWRLFQEFKEHIGYVDIETTGLSKHANRITTISVWDGKDVRTYVAGDNMTEENLEEEFDRHKMLCSFNGIGFDIPFIQAKFPNLNLDKPHMDLRWVGQKVGLRGGLKKIEKELNIVRDDEIAEVDGRFAVRLWKRWERMGDQKALDLLIRYNQEDVINLEKLGNIVYSMLCNGESTPTFINKI